MKRNSTFSPKCQIVILYFCIMFCNGFLNNSFAQDRIEIHSSPNPVGSGARALGMGGAFIAVADDATAASWNPGGLTQLRKPEISIVGAAFHRIEDNMFGKHPEADGKQILSVPDRVNYFSAAYPFPWLGQNMTLSLNYQNLYDFNRQWNFSTKIEDEKTNNIWNTKTDFDQNGSLSAWGIAYAVRTRWLPQVSFGFTVNLWEDGLYKNELEKRQSESGAGVHKETNKPFTFEIRNDDRYSFSGTNFNFGILWDVTGNFTVGMVLKTPFKADLKHAEDAHTVRRNSEGEITSYSDKVGEKDETLEMPMSYGIGMAYRFSDRFTASFDIYRTQWNDFVLRDSDGKETSPVTGKPLGESDIDPTLQIRMGAEYLFMPSKYIVPVCIGAFYDPAPAEGDPDNIFGFSAGLGFSDGKRFTFDLAYQYRFGNRVGDSILQGWKFSQDLQEHTVYASLIIYFDRDAYRKKTEPRQ